MRRLRIGYTFALTVGLARPMVLVACGSPTRSAGSVGTRRPPRTDRHAEHDRGPDTIAHGRPGRATPRPLPETGPEPGYDRTTFGRSTTVDNKWFPLRPGTRLSYRGQTIEDGERLGHTVTFVVTDLTKVIDGVRNVVVWERDYNEGVLVESELAFFAQADDGNVWHFGQYPEVYEGGKLIETPAWIHGVKGAQGRHHHQGRAAARRTQLLAGLGPGGGLVGPRHGCIRWASAPALPRVASRASSSPTSSASTSPAPIS